MHCILEVSRYKNVVYIGVYLVLTYKKRVFSTVYYSLSYFIGHQITWVESVNSIVFYWHAQRLRQGVYLSDFSIVIYGKFNSNFAVLILAFFHLICKLLKSLFSPFLLVSKLYKLSLWVIELILEMSRNVSVNLYLRPFSIAIYGKFCLCFLYYSDFFWSVNCTNLVWKLDITF